MFFKKECFKEVIDSYIKVIELSKEINILDLCLFNNRVIIYFKLSNFDKCF